MIDVPSGSRNEGTRRRNLSALLRTIHYSGPTSRAELTRLTGLNRSTIKVLVDELVHTKLAFESDPPDDGAVGRPSPIVNPSKNVVAIAVNPDIDAVVVGRVGFGGDVRMRVRVEVDKPPTVADAVKITRETVNAMPGTRAKAAGVGIVLPGLVRSSDHLVVDAPHLDWRDEDVAAAFAGEFGVQAYVDNDAKGGLRAESHFGAVAASDAVYINGSTSGIGGAVAMNGITLNGASGYAGQIGHTRVPISTKRCRCGRQGCLESEVNMSLLAAAANRDHLDPEGLGDIFADRSNLTLATEIDRQIDVLAIAIANVISNFNPASVVLGGFVGALFDARPDALRAAVAREAFPELAADATLIRASLGERRLMIGAAELVFKPLLDDPAWWLSTRR